MVTVVSTQLIDSLSDKVELRAPSLGVPVQLDVLGIATLTMTFGNGEYQWDAYVAPIREFGLLGYHFLCHFECVVDARKGLQIGGVSVPCEIRGLGLSTVRVVVKESTGGE